MIQTIQKIIKIGSSKGVTLPAKELERQNLDFGDEVEVTIRPVRKAGSEDEQVIRTAKKILQEYKSDFKNLAQR